MLVTKEKTERVEHLIDQGFSLEKISEMQGVSVEEVEKIYLEKTGKIFYESEQKLLRKL
jgi:hypothetical protein